MRFASRILSWLILIGACIPIPFAMFFILAEAIRTYGFTGLAWVTLAAPFLFLSGIAVHEGAHLAAAVLNRMRVASITIGPVAIARFDNRFRLHIRFRHLMRMLGFVVASPTRHSNVDGQLATLVAAGPLASLVVFLICAATILLLPGFPDAMSSASAAVFVWLGSFAVANFIFALEIVPIWRNDVPNDGALLFDLAMGSHASQRNRFALMVGTQMVAGVRPRDLDEPLIEEMLARRTGQSSDCSANYLAACWELDRGHVEEAGRLLDLACAQGKDQPLIVRDGAKIELAHFEARFRGNPKKAADLLRSVSDVFGMHASARLRAEAAILLAEEKREQALARARQSLDALRSSLDIGGAIAEREWIQSIIEAASAKAPSSLAEPSPINEQSPVFSDTTADLRANP